MAHHGPFEAYHALRLHWKQVIIDVGGGIHIATHSLHCAKQSRGTVVLIHGITGHSRNFSTIARHLVEHFDLLAIDLRGRGNSSKPTTAAAYGFAQHARDVAVVFAQHQLQSAHVMGHSMGAFVVEQLAHDFPQLVKSMILLDGGWPRLETTAVMSEATKAGLKRVQDRLSMKFSSVDAYLNFWYPSQGITIASQMAKENKLEELDFLEHYNYDLMSADSEETPGLLKPKCEEVAFCADYAYVSESALKESDFQNIKKPVMFVRAGQGFLVQSPALIPHDRMQLISSLLSPKLYVDLPHHTHYSMMFREAAEVIAQNALLFITRFTSV